MDILDTQSCVGSTESGPDEHGSAGRNSQPFALLRTSARRREWFKTGKCPLLLQEMRCPLLLQEMMWHG